MASLPSWLVRLSLGLLLISPVGARQPIPETTEIAVPRLEETLVDSEITGTLFDKFLKYKTYRILTSAGTELTGGFVYGPGHHISAMAALVLNPEGVPYATFKTGDTRLSRALRSEPYVAISGIAGRWDKEGYSAGKIVLGELSEEVGGEVVEGTFRRLGDSLAPTMPNESTESDEYFMAAVRITGKPYGDGGQMEVVDLIGPIFLSPTQAIEAMDEGGISDAGRARAMFGRAWASIGYLPRLDVYVQDYPALLARYDSLGLGVVDDLRSRAKGAAVPAQRAKAETMKGRINAAVVTGGGQVGLADGSQMVDARIRHAVSENGQRLPVGPEFASQYLRLDYDRAKLALFYVDPQKGPMVEMAPVRRPALAFAPGSPAVVRRDVGDLKVSRGPSSRSRGLPAEQEAGWAAPPPLLPLPLDIASLPGEPIALAMQDAASSGQSDLFYYYLASRVDAPPDRQSAAWFVTLAEAIRLCRQGQGDAQTEATLLRLADHLDWIPELGMPRSEASALIGKRKSSP